MKNKIIVLAVILTNFLHGQELTEEFKAQCVNEKAYDPGKGYVAVIDCNSGFDCSAITNFFFPRGKCMRISYVLNKGSNFSLKDAKKEKKALNANAAIFIISDKSMPLSLNAPEEGWALINYALISEDKAPQRIILDRMDKMFSRATMHVLGAGSFMMFKNSASKFIRNAKDLDALVGKSPAPEAMSSMFLYMRQLGFREPREAPYYVACQQGWANTPTNAVQKYIWDAVHTIPTNPMKIKYQPKK